MSTQRPQIMGDIAHDVADTTGSFPTKIGGVGNAALPTGVTEGDRVSASFDLSGRQRVLALGDIAHDGADTSTSNPIKVGGFGTAALPTAVTEGDRVNASFDLQGGLRTRALGDIAHDGADTSTSWPLKVGGQAINFDGTDPGSVAEGDRTHFKANPQGGIFADISNPFAWHTSMAFAAGTTGAAVVAAPGVNLSLHVTDIIASCQTTGANFILREDTTTAIHLQFDMGAADHIEHTFRNPLRFAANKPLQLTVTTTNTTFNISGYTAP